MMRNVISFKYDGASVFAENEETAVEGERRIE
jgi:hypothetical protein